LPSPNATAILAKAPESGRVKTRLLGLLSPHRAAELHHHCLQDTVALVESVPGCQKWFLVASGQETARRLADTLALGAGWKVRPQRGHTLGARLEHAAETAFRTGAGKVVLVGTDTPWMGRQRILLALALLDAADVVLGPTADGGYYLVAARRLLPQMFRGIPWGTPQVSAVPV